MGLSTGSGEVAYMVDEEATIESSAEVLARLKFNSRVLTFFLI